MAIEASCCPPFALAATPIIIVLAVNLVMSVVVLPRIYTGFLAEPRFGEDLALGGERGLVRRDGRWHGALADFLC